MDIKKLVLDTLKPRAAALGFNKEELESVADSISNNLVVSEESSEEQTTAAVSKAVDAVLPILQVSQRNASRIITKNREDMEKAEKERKEAEAKKKADDEAKAKAEKEAKEKAEAEKKAEEERNAKYEEALKKAKGEEEVKEPETNNGGSPDDYLKLLREENEKLVERQNALLKDFKKLSDESKKREDAFKAFQDEFNTMKASRVRETREKRLADILKDTGTYGARIQKNYSRMTFDSDEDFDTFCNEISEDIKAFNQERANIGLEKMGISASGGDTTRETKQEVMTDKEIDDLAAIM